MSDDPKTDSAIQILEGAIDVLERNGWRQHSYGPTNPKSQAPHCLVGALRMAAKQVDDRSGRFVARNALSEVISESHDLRTWGHHSTSTRVNLEGWNDSLGESSGVEKVLTALKRALKKLKS